MKQVVLVVTLDVEDNIPADLLATEAQDLLEGLPGLEYRRRIREAVRVETRDGRI